ncbi:MAG: OB-fold nucleic acid binding domain-containing protein [Acidimicrobiia bacterium]
MGVKGFLKRVSTPTEEADRLRLVEYIDRLGLTPLDQLPLRKPVRFAGEVTSLRIVPRAGAPAVEIAVTDGRGAAVAVFLGRARVRGITPGRRLVIEGVPLREGTENVVYNPTYELLA